MNAKNFFNIEVRDNPFVFWTTSDVIRVMEKYASHSVLPKFLSYFVPTVVISLLIGVFIGAFLIAIIYL